ncbi:Filamentous hemagglutinin [Labeo rohita]|uniref:Filamentous hemagglutinin n=1 Tax=Labeo rohita TaxID=84645 RepID=A0ABQ8LYQ1_LABRO|nr:Filamentous hemagglutinin [Labeo rohita]
MGSTLEWECNNEHIKWETFQTHAPMSPQHQGKRAQNVKQRVVTEQQERGEIWKNGTKAAKPLLIFNPPPPPPARFPRSKPPSTLGFGSSIRRISIKSSFDLLPIVTFSVGNQGREKEHVSDPEMLDAVLQKEGLPWKGAPCIWRPRKHALMASQRRLCGTKGSSSAFFLLPFAAEPLDVDKNACQSSGVGPQVSFAAFEECVLVRNGSPFTVGLENDLASPTPDAERSLSSPCCAEPKPETATINKPLPRRAIELEIVPEPEPLGLSDRVCEPATALAMRDSKSTEGSFAYCTMVEGELSSADCVLPALPLSSSVCPELSVCPFLAKEVVCELSICPELSACLTTRMEVISLSLAFPVPGMTLWCVWAAHTVPKPPDHTELPPSLPLPPPLHQSSPSSLLFPGSFSAHPQPTICVVGLPRICQSPSALWLEDPLSPPPASKSRTPPRPAALVAPAWLLVPSSPSWPVSPPALPGPLVPPAPSWSVITIRCLWTSVLWLHLVPPGSVRLLLPSSVAAAPPWPSGSPPPPWPSRSSSSHWLVGSSSPPQAPFPPALPPSDSPLESSSPSSIMAPPSVASTVGRLHGCGLGPTWLLLLQVSSCLLPGFSCFLLGFSLHHLHPGLLLPGVRPPPEPPPVLSACLPASPLPFPSPSHIHSFVLLLSPPPSHP